MEGINFSATRHCLWRGRRQLLQTKQHASPVVKKSNTVISRSVKGGKRRSFFKQVRHVAF